MAWPFSDVAPTPAPEATSNHWYDGIFAAEQKAEQIAEGGLAIPVNAITGVVGNGVSTLLRPLIVPLILLIIGIIALTVLIGKAERVAQGG